MGFQSLGNILPSRLSQHGVSGDVMAAVVCQAFDEVIGKNGGPLSGQVKAVQFNKDTLVVDALSAAAAVTLKGQANAISDQTNRKLARTAIKQMRIRVRAGN